MLTKLGEDNIKFSGPEALIYGAGILGGGSLGWLLSAATNSAEKHKKRRLWYALAGAAAGGAGAHAFLQSDNPVPLNGKTVSRAEFYRVGDNGKRYRLKTDPDSVFTETQKACMLTTPAEESDVVAKGTRLGTSLGLGGLGSYSLATLRQKGKAGKKTFEALKLNGPYDPAAPDRVRLANEALDEAVNATTPKSVLGKAKQVAQHVRRNYNDFKQISWKTPEDKLSKALDILKDPTYVREARLKRAEDILSKDDEFNKAFGSKESGGASTTLKPDLGALYDLRQSGSRPVVSTGKSQKIKIDTHAIGDNPGGRLGTAAKTTGKGLVGLLASFLANKAGTHLFPSSTDFPGYTDADFELIQD